MKDAIEIPDDLRAFISSKDGGSAYFPPGAIDHIVKRYLGEQTIIDEIVRYSGFTDMETVVDYGCNLGGWLWRLSKLNGHVVGIDADDLAVDICRRILSRNDMNNVSVIKGDRLRPTLRLVPDGIICIGALCSIMDGASFHRLFKHAFEILQPGGRFLILYFLPQLALDNYVNREAATLIEKHGVEFATKRHENWKRMYLLGNSPTILKNSVYYCSTREAMIKLSEEYGFTIELLHEDFSKHTRCDDLESYRNTGRENRHYEYMLVRKPE